MFRLMEVLLFTPDVNRMRAFYEQVLGLRYDTASPTWTAYTTRGALLALRPLLPGHSPYVELTFATEDLDRAVNDLRSRGAEIRGEITSHGWGRLVRLSDFEGNPMAIAQPRAPVHEGDGLALGTAVVGSRDLAHAKSFYHHVMGLPLQLDTPRWVQFDTGPTRLALLPRPREAGERQGRSVSFGFSIPGLMDWAEEARGRGLRFATAPRAEDWGLFANALDPDGNEVRFYEPAAPPSLEEELAEDFDDETVPHQTAIRKPVKKASKAASRVALRPEYKPKGPPRRRRPSGTTTRVASVRGAGAERTRLTPKRTADEKKAKVKPAQGRLQKAKIGRLDSQKTDVARASRTRPVKRGNASRTTRRGAAGRRAETGRGAGRRK